MRLDRDTSQAFQLQKGKLNWFTPTKLSFIFFCMKWHHGSTSFRNTPALSSSLGCWGTGSFPAPTSALKCRKKIFLRSGQNQILLKRVSSCLKWWVQNTKNKLCESFYVQISYIVYIILSDFFSFWFTPILCQCLQSNCFSSSHQCL